MKKILVIILLVFTSLILHAQNDKQKEHAIFDALTNKEWIGKGKLMGQDASFKMNWRKVLGDKFVKLKFENRRKSKDNKDITFKAMAYYKLENDSAIVGTWFDNRGMILPLKGSVKKDKLTILWGNEQTEMGKTIYRYDHLNNTIVVEDFILNNEKYYRFGSATYNPKE